MKLPVLASTAICAVVGLAAHQTDRLLCHVFGDKDIGKLAHYAEGTVLLAGAFTLLNRQHHHELTPDKSLADFILAAVSVGLGTLIGYVIDVLRGKK